MVQLLTWEWLARDILFQLANDRCIGLPWRRSGRVMVYWMSRDTTTIWDWDWTAWESPRPVHCIHTSRAFVSTSGLKKEFKGKHEIDPVFPCHGGGYGDQQSNQHQLGFIGNVFFSCGSEKCWYRTYWKPEDKKCVFQLVEVRQFDIIWPWTSEK